jgi:glc operon protein GlcG
LPLITRNHAKLTLEGARAVLAAAELHATEMQIPMNIAVVDDGAHLLAFARMDGAKPASIKVALVKARAAAMRRAPTGPAMSGAQVNVALALGLASAGPDQQTPIRGGLPLLVDGEVVGAIGVSAGTEDQDLDVARAGAAAFEKAKS